MDAQEQMKTRYHDFRSSLTGEANTPRQRFMRRMEEFLHWLEDHPEVRVPDHAGIYWWGAHKQDVEDIVAAFPEAKATRRTDTDVAMEWELQPRWPGAIKASVSVPSNLTKPAPQPKPALPRWLADLADASTTTTKGE